MKAHLVLTLVAACAIASSVMAAGTYKCTDAQGRIEYRELPLDGLQCIEIRKRTSQPIPPQADSAPQQNDAEPEPKPTAADAENTDLKAQNCASAKRNLELLQGDSDVVSADADGNKTVMTATQREAAIAQVNKDIEYFCD